MGDPEHSLHDLSADRIESTRPEASKNRPVDLLQKPRAQPCKRAHEEPVLRQYEGSRLGSSPTLRHHVRQLSLRVRVVPQAVVPEKRHLRTPTKERWIGSHELGGPAEESSSA